MCNIADATAPRKPGDPIRCTFSGCRAKTWQPYADGWAGLASWGPGIPDGFYCRAHADAIESLFGDEAEAAR
jgi:hypothetical protein